MEHNSPHLRIIRQLALEYDEKYQELEKLISETQPENTLPQLRALAERAVDNFRTAQIAMLSMPGFFEGEGGQRALQAMTALSRAFDEMRILFNFLVETRPH
jgi:hypothetical protein